MLISDDISGNAVNAELFELSVGCFLFLRAVGPDEIINHVTQYTPASSLVIVPLVHAPVRMPMLGRRANKAFFMLSRYPR